jgi:outer membrane protein assembly factor BamB
MKSPLRYSASSAVEALVVLALFVVPVAAAEPDPWPSFRKDAADTAACRWEPAAADQTIREWSFRGRPGTRYKPGVAVWASPALAVVDGRPMAFIGGFDKTMHALDLLAKEERWAKVTNGPIAESPAVGLVDGRPVVFWGSADGNVYACLTDPQGAYDGRQLWEPHPLVPMTGTMEAQLSAPLLHAGTLYISCFVYDRAMSRSEQAGWLVAMDMRTGRELWRHEAAPGMLSSPTGGEIGGRFTIFLAARRGLLQAFDASAAGAPRLLWKYQMPHEVLGSPAIDADPDNPRVFLGSKFGNLIALDARTGKELWKRMAGNWIDNSACVGQVAGVRAVFAGSHDYRVWAFRASDGQVLWKRPLGGEVYSAPAYFTRGEGQQTDRGSGSPSSLVPRPSPQAFLAVASLDNHLYVLEADTGRVYTSYFTGKPMWDKVAKGEMLWGSPVALEAGDQTALFHGSFNGEAYVLPLDGSSGLRAKVQSAATLWWGLGVTAAIFLGLVLPAVLWRRPQGGPS